jgi:hypothetical protein
MDGSLNIGVSLRFEKFDEIPAGLAMLAVQCINSAAYRRELRDLRAIRAEFREIPAVAFDAAEQRMRQSRKDAVLLRGLREGSVEIAVVGAGLAIWLLKVTLGETVKEAWLESGLHERVKMFLLRRREEKYHAIAEDAQRQLERQLGARVEMGYSDNLEHVTITLRVWFHPDEYPRFPRQHEDNF